MPRLWDDTIDAHRRAVRETIVTTTVALVGRRGQRSVTMSEIAERAGVGRATLYKYFADVESILVAWHHDQISAHLEQLTALRDRAHGARQALEAVLERYASIQHEHHGTEMASLLHQSEHVAHAEKHLFEFLKALLEEGVADGDVRTDVAPGELANYCLHALGGAGALPSKAAVRRLVRLTLDGLAPSAAT